jgi:uncharacterized membrane protein
MRKVQNNYMELLNVYRRVFIIADFIKLRIIFFFCLFLSSAYHHMGLSIKTSLSIIFFTLITEKTGFEVYFTSSQLTCDPDFNLFLRVARVIMKKKSRVLKLVIYFNDFKNCVKILQKFNKA